MMTVEEKGKNWVDDRFYFLDERAKDDVMCGYIAGATENGVKWHKVTDWKNQDQFPDDELKIYLVCIKNNPYALCSYEITDGYGQFYLADGIEEVDPENVIAWCEIPTYTE